MSHPAPDQLAAPEPIPARTPGPSRLRGHARAILALAAVLGATLWFRSPILVNAAGLNSDAAVVGLQARHMLHGEWSPFLWGAGYQSSVEAVIAAAIFSIAGATPLALALVPLLGHLLSTWFAFDVLRRRSSPWVAALLMIPLVFAPLPVSTILINVARSWSVTAVFASVWLLDGASESRRPLLRWAAGSYLALIAVYLDLFSLVFLGGIAILALATTFDDAPPRRAWVRRFLACGGGAAAGLACLWLIRGSSGASSEAKLATSRVAHNLQLLFDTCLPWVLGTKTFVWSGSLYPTLWTPPPAYAWFPVAAALCVGALLAISAVVVVARRRSEWRACRIGIFGLAVIASTFVAFLLSLKPEDMWSARYLAPAVFAAPFALAPAQQAIGTWFTPLILPYMLSAAVSGWLAHGSAVSGPFPVAASRPMNREVVELRDELRKRGIRHGVAQYWLSYRLSFLFEENPIVVPLEPAEDRYAPYRDAMVTAPVVAFIFHPSEPRARPEPVAEMLQRNGTPFERLSIAGYTVLVAAPTGPR